MAKKRTGRAVVKKGQGRAINGLELDEALAELTSEVHITMRPVGSRRPRGDQDAQAPKFARAVRLEVALALRVDVLTVELVDPDES